MNINNYYEIATHIHDPLTYKNYVLSCKLISKACKHLKQQKKKEFQLIPTRKAKMFIVSDEEYHVDGAFSENVNQNDFIQFQKFIPGLLLQGLKRGDIIHFETFGDTYNDGKCIYDGEEIVNLCYDRYILDTKRYNDYGGIPKEFKCIEEFPINYWNDILIFRWINVDLNLIKKLIYESKTLKLLVDARSPNKSSIDIFILDAIIWYENIEYKIIIYNINDNKDNILKGIPHSIVNEFNVEYISEDEMYDDQKITLYLNKKYINTTLFIEL